MKLITRDTDYALRAICCIVRHKDKRVSAVRLVKKLKMPYPFLRKLLQQLDKNGILKSYKGKGGGFVLAKAPGDILVLDLIKIFQGPLKLNECLFKKSCCPNITKCLLKKKIDKIEDYVIKELRTISISSLVKKRGKG